MIQLRCSGCLLCLGFLLLSCKQAVFTGDQEKTSAYVVAIKGRDINIYNYKVAEMVAIQNIEIRNRNSGYLKRVYVDEGEHIAAGKLMFSFNSDEVIATLNKELANLRSTEAERNVARLEVANMRALVDKGIISYAQLEIALAKLGTLDARVSAIQQNVALAKLHVNYTDVKAPFSGIVNRIPYKAGSFLSAGALLTTLSDVHKMYAYFYISEGEYLRLLKGRHRSFFDSTKRVGLILTDGTPYRHTGVIQTVVGEFENNTGSIAVRALFPNPDKILKHRASARVAIPLRFPDALMVPKKSVLDIQSKKYVYLLQRDGSVKMQSFRSDYTYGDYFIVAEGLKENDTIIYEGLQRIKAHTKVRPIMVSMDSLWSLSQVSSYSP